MRKGKANANTSVKYAILGLLVKRPSYPYELANLFDKRIGAAWELNRGQVYQIVYQLEEEGLVERMEGSPNPQASNPHGIKCFYRITPRGVEAFDRWRRSRAERVKPVRDDLIIRISLAEVEDIPHLLGEIARREQALADRLLEYTDIDAAHVAVEKASRLEEVGPALSTRGVLGKLNFEMEQLALAREALVRVEAKGLKRRARVPATG